MTQSLLTTGGPPAAGYNGVGLIFTSIDVTFEPNLVMNFDPTTTFSVGIVPQLQMLGPQFFTTQLSPTLAITAGTTARTSFIVPLSPQFAPATGTTAIATFRPTLAPSLAVGASTRESASLHASLTPSLELTATGISRVSYSATGPGKAGTTTGTATYTDTIPTGATCTLIWASSSSTSASPTLSASVGSASATLVAAVETGFNSPNYDFIVCFALLNPPTGSQTISFTSSATSSIAMNTVHYSNVSSVGTAITATNQSGQPSITAPSTTSGYMYANGFAYVGTSGNTFSAYNQTQRYLVAQAAGSNYPLLIGDATGAGAALTFSATRSSTSFGWGGIIVPLSP